MPGRRESLRPVGRLGSQTFEVPFGVALRRALAIGYDAAALRADLLAGAVVGIVALPLSMASAIDSGRATMPTTAPASRSARSAAAS